MLLIDTNVWFAAIDRRSRHHEACAELLTERRSELVSTVPVLCETSWMLLDRLGSDAQTRFLRMIVAGQVTPLDLNADDWRRCLELVTTYADMKLDLIDASVIAVAERLGLTQIASMNGRDFYAVRPVHVDGFELLPEGLARH